MIARALGLVALWLALIGADPVEAHLLHKIEQRLEFLFGLAGIAHDEGGAQR